MKLVERLAPGSQKKIYDLASLMQVFEKYAVYPEDSDDEELTTLVGYVLDGTRNIMS